MPAELKLSTPRPRTEIISEFQYKLANAEAPPEAGDDDGVKEDVADEGADNTVAAKLATATSAIEEAIAAQEGDPDAEGDPNDAAVSSDLSEALASLKKAEADQTKDEGGDDAEKTGEDEDPDATTAASEPPDQNSVCQDTSCGHAASKHEDTDSGKSQGACLTAGCKCNAFKSSEEPSEDDDTDGTPATGDDDLAVEDAAPAMTDETTKPPAVEGAELMGSEFTIPVGVIEGEPTGDGRAIALGALDWRECPLPLMGMATGTHDPSGMSPNAPSVLCGRIDSITREAGPTAGTEVLSAHGYFLPNDDGTYYSELAQSMGRIGVSADIAVVESEQEIGEVDGMGFPIDMSETLTKGTLMAFTIVPTPAFEGAYLVLGDGTTTPSPIPQESGEEASTASAAPIHFMSYEACEPCMHGTDVIAASAGPVAPPAAWFADPNFTEGDGRLQEIYDHRGKRVVGGKYGCPLTVDKDGRVYGHMAIWGICHNSFAQTCVLAQDSKVDYAFFKRGSVLTAEGEVVRTGAITMDGPHASTKGISAAQAMAHYDDTTMAIADVNMGRDEYGIWVAGAVRPDATEEDIRALRGASLSGDWRRMGGNMEAIGCLAVNIPGFSMAVVADGHTEAMVAAGAQVLYRVKHPEGPEVVDSDAVVMRALAPLFEQQRANSTARLQRLAAQRRLSRLR